ncbi:nitrilase-related carbon-nitrogen hydrolase [Blastococcus saxobsidens]|uniref:Carbon-nitrogen hydrolase n=1 Tax=Blastococcus saxobsidens TaxID=138336 RepID=A0A4V2G281_9ACTN|nr:nitrilase-related carbon-nitrogen hydrolase [Blastococcus saxobsidens]RZU32116.1 carbon-nitrogen hydrolase [Blastococcus saxobsidens]
MRIALSQGPAETPDPEAGLAAVAVAARSAAAAGARLLVTPEMSLTGYAIGAERVAELAEPLPELLVVDVDPAARTAWRRVNTHLADRRPELYLPEQPA